MIQHKQKKIFATLFIFCNFAACKPRDASANLKLEEGKPIRSPDRWQWETVEKNEFLSVIAPSSGLDPKLLHFRDSPSDKGATKDLVERLATWIDNFDATVRKGQSNMNSVPKPNLVLTPSEEANAYVPPLPVCLDVPIALGGAPNGGVLPYVSMGTDGIMDLGETSPTCIRRSFDDRQLADLLRWFNSNHPQCRVTARAPVQAPGAPRNSTAYSLEQGCSKNPELLKYKEAKGIVLWTTPNWIVVHTGLVTSFLKEEQILPVLAHELGHYYRSHMTTYENQYDYFYDRSKARYITRPDPNDTLRPIGAKAVQASRLLNLAEVADVNFHPALFPVAYEIITSICGEASRCPSSCKNINALFENPKFSKWFGDFPSDPLETGQGNKKYTQFLAQWPACGASVILKGNASQSSTTSTTISPTLLEYSLKHGQIDTLVPPISKLPSNASANLKNAFKAYTEEIYQVLSPANGVSSAAEQAVEAAVTQSIGWYTTEQEADEFGIQYVVKLGLEGNAAIHADFVFFGGADIFERAQNTPESVNAATTNISIENCAKAYMRKPPWSNADRRQPFFPPIGDYFDDHHSDCFRMYNLDQELSIHKYNREVRGSSLRLLDEARWKLLTDAAGKLTAENQSQTPRINDAIGARRAKRFLRECKYLRRKQAVEVGG